MTTPARDAKTPWAGRDVLAPAEVLAHARAHRRLATGSMPLGPRGQSLDLLVHGRSWSAEVQRGGVEHVTVALGAMTP